MGFRHQKGVSPHEAPKTAKGKALGISKELLDEIEIEVLPAIEEETTKPKKTAAKAKKKPAAKNKKKKKKSSPKKTKKTARAE